MNGGNFVLGEKVAAPTEYAPEVLYPIPRALSRNVLGLNERALPFVGADYWHLYELSWLRDNGVPETRVGRLRVPFDSPYIVESKSLKLYLNSLNFMMFAAQDDLQRLIQDDVGKVVGAPVTLELFGPDDARILGGGLVGMCLDGLEPTEFGAQPDPKMLRVLAEGSEEQAFYTHQLRSLCPVTAQPDWASLQIKMVGDDLLPQSVLAYLLSYRTHQEYHEQCVERIYNDLWQTVRPQQLFVQAFYLRRGGIDITPMRASEHDFKPLTRLTRQ